LGAVTLLIGNNNSGKSNLLAGIRHFSQLVARSRPSQQPDRSQLRQGDFFPHRYRLAAEREPIDFSCVWEDHIGTVEYSVTLYDLSSRIAAKESICARLKKAARTEKAQLMTGFAPPADRLVLLRTLLQDPPSRFSEAHCKLCERFFRNMAETFAYHFQPSYLKGLAKCEWPRVDPEHLVVPSQLGYEGGNLQEVLLHYRQSNERAFQRFIAALRRFDPSFHGIRKGKDGKPLWEFDLGRDEPGRLDEFGPEVVSDGLVKAAAISLLTTVRHPPALILVEEIENGVNPANIEEFITWLWQATRSRDEGDNGQSPQFVLTSHSPTVLRQFDEHLENVYTVHLDRHGFKSDVRNLAESLDTLIGIGSIDGEIVERNGKKTVRIPRSELGDLWYSGTIG